MAPSPPHRRSRAAAESHAPSPGTWAPAPSWLAEHRLDGQSLEARSYIAAADRVGNDGKDLAVDPAGERDFRLAVGKGHVVRAAEEHSAAHAFLQEQALELPPGLTGRREEMHHRPRAESGAANRTVGARRR